MRRHSASAGNLLRLAIVGGLWSGVLQLVVLWVQKYVRQDPIHRGAHVTWMAPLAEILLLLLVALCLFALSFVIRRLNNHDIQSAVIVFFSGLGVLFGLERLAWWAALVLAVGIASQSPRIVQRWPAQFARLLNLSGVVLASAVVVVSVYVTLNYSRSGHTLVAGSRSQRPNIILVIWDTVRALSTSTNGYQRRTTPFLEKLGTSGIVFERAYATAPWTLPSHVSMFTGLLHHQMDVGWAIEFKQKVPTLAQELAANGYRTGAFVANLIYTDVEHGLGHGFQYYSDHAISFGEILWNSATLRRLFEPSSFLARLTGPRPYLWHKNAATINAQFFDWLDGKTNAPFFAFLNYFDAHGPYVPPAEFESRFGSIDRPDLWERLRAPLWSEDLKANDVTPERITEELRAYEASIAYLDYELERLVAELDKRGLRTNTLIIVTSDHGEEFGEHGKFTHGQTLFLPSLHVPLVIAYSSGIPADVRIRTPVSLRDIAATILDIADIETHRIPGQSWRRLWEQPDARADALVVSGGAKDLFSLELNLSFIDERFHYIDGFADTGKTFDLASDPGERAALRKPPPKLADAAKRIRACDATKARRTPQCPAW